MPEEELSEKGKRLAHNFCFCFFDAEVDVLIKIVLNTFHPPYISSCLTATVGDLEADGLRTVRIPDWKGWSNSFYKFPHS